MSQTAVHPATAWSTAAITAPVWNAGTSKFESTISTATVTSYTVYVVGNNAATLSSVSAAVIFNVNSCGSPAVTMSNTIATFSVTTYQDYPNTVYSWDPFTCDDP